MALMLLTILLLLSTTAFAFPFAKNSGVTELNAKTLPGFLNTHKPVFIMFYAPWCGHCKSMHPDYAKFGTAMKDVVRVGAVNADQHKDLGGQFGIQGFPTIKYWKMGNKKGMKPQDYQGPRTKNGLHNAAIAEIKPNVKTATSIDQVKESINSASGKSIVLFSSKNKSPPMFSVLSQSPHFKEKVNFVLVTEKAKDIVGHFGVEKFPRILLLSKDSEAENGLSQQPYEGQVDYTSIAKFLKGALGEDVESNTQEEAETSEKPKPEPVKNTRPATPVRPEKLTDSNFATFCSKTAPKVNGQLPFCVVALGEEIDLKPLHSHFERDSVLFFYAESSTALMYADDFQTGLQPSPSAGKGDVIVLRASKDRTKYVVWYASDHKEEDTTESLSGFIERALAGETTFDRHPGFPVLRKL